MTSAERTPGASIAVRDVPNLRDLGGWSTTEGRTVRYGLVFRSTDLSRIRPTSLEALQLRTVVDLRTAAERGAAPDRPVEGATEVVADVLADSQQALPANIPQLLADPQALAAALSSAGPHGVSVSDMIAETYRDLVRLDSARASYREVLQLLADGSELPLLFHCTTGKDRTGWGAAVLLLLLGVAEADVEREYLLTNTQLLPTFEPLLRPFAESGGDRALLEAVLGVDPRYLHAALDEMRTLYGSVENYVAEGLGIDLTAQQQVRDRLLT